MKDAGLKATARADFEHTRPRVKPFSDSPQFSVPEAFQCTDLWREF
jgi:hypothetical protein